MSDSRDKNKMIDLHKIRARICEMIVNDKSDFRFQIIDKFEQEYVEIDIQYDVCGVHYDKEAGALKLIINVNKKEPIDVKLNFDTFLARLEEDIAKQFPFLVKDTYYISVDMVSINEINTKMRLKEFKEELARLIERRGFTMDDALPTLVDYVNESLSKSSYKSINDILVHSLTKSIEKKHKPTIEILSPGAPCPYCDTHLSIENIRRLMMNCYSRYHGDNSFDD